MQGEHRRQEEEGECLRPHLIEDIIPVDHPHLRDREHDEEDRGRELDGRDLGVQLHETEPRGPVERLPCVEHGHDALATHELGLHLPAKGSIEGNDGVILLRQERGLDALEGDVGGEDDEDGGQEAAGEHGEGGERNRFLLHLGQVLEAAGVCEIALEVEDLEEGDGDADGSLFGEGPHGGREEDLLALVEGGEATVPFLLARGADDDVGPEHLQAAEDDGGEDGGEGLRDQSAAEEGGQELEEHVVHEMVDESDLEATEAGPGSGFSLEVFDGGADLGGDGFGLDVEELELGDGV